jgi:hypothetical protein
MAHNPPRVWFTDEHARDVARSAAKELRQAAQNWRDLKDLAGYIGQLARLGEHVTLTPRTAHIVAAQLETAAAKPTRDEIALMICRRGEANQCQEPCYDCRGRANIVVRAYGCRLDQPRPK